MKIARRLLAAAALSVAASGGQAALVTGFTPDTVIDFDGIFGGPESVALNAAVTLSGFGSPADRMEVGSPAFWGLGDNGFWSLGRTFAGYDASIGGLLVSFNGQAVQSVGAVLNHFSGGVGDSLELAALDVNGNVLETHTVTIGTPGGENAGAFAGISRAVADIGFLRVTAPQVVMDDLSYTAPVPEPSTWAMLFGGLGLLALVRHRAARP